MVKFRDCRRGARSSLAELLDAAKFQTCGNDCNTDKMAFHDALRKLRPCKKRFLHESKPQGKELKTGSLRGPIEERMKNWKVLGNQQLYMSQPVDGNGGTFTFEFSSELEDQTEVTGSIQFAVTQPTNVNVMGELFANGDSLTNGAQPFSQIPVENASDSNSVPLTVSFNNFALLPIRRHHNSRQNKITLVITNNSTAYDNPSIPVSIMMKDVSLVGTGAVHVSEKSQKAMQRAQRAIRKGQYDSPALLDKRLRDWTQIGVAVNQVENNVYTAAETIAPNSSISLNQTAHTADTAMEIELDTLIAPEDFNSKIISVLLSLFRTKADGSDFTAIATDIPLINAAGALPGSSSQDETSFIFMDTVPEPGTYTYSANIQNMSTDTSLVATSIKFEHLDVALKTAVETLPPGFSYFPRAPDSLPAPRYDYRDSHPPYPRITHLENNNLFPPEGDILVPLAPTESAVVEVVVPAGTLETDLQAMITYQALNVPDGTAVVVDIGLSVNGETIAHAGGPDTETTTIVGILGSMTKITSLDHFIPWVTALVADALVEIQVTNSSPVTVNLKNFSVTAIDQSIM